MVYSSAGSPFFGRLLKLPTFLVVYGVSIFTGQLVARLYWTYKRCFSAAKHATLNTYLQYKTYSNSAEKYKYYACFRDVRPNLVQ